MWGRLTVLCALMCVTFSAPFPATPCPDSCSCTVINTGHLEAHCRSFEFLNKLQPKQVNAIVSLDLSNNNLTKIHNKLKKLKNLQIVNLANNNIYDITELSFLQKLTNLNLKSNHIKYFTAASLPKHLTHLDVSYNYLNHIPHGLHQLSSLKEVNFYENPISCSCDVLKERDFLLNAGIFLVKPVTCHSPENLKGQLLQKAHCAKFDQNHLEDQMQGDEPAVEGSGDIDEMHAAVSGERVIFNDHIKNEKVLSTIADDELIPQSHNDFVHNTSNDENEEINDEGSGDIFNGNITENNEEYYDEGSGSDENATVLPPISFEEEQLPACNFDCSTPLPLDINKTDDNATGDPDIIREIGIGLGVIPEHEPSSTTEEPLIQRSEINKIGISRKKENDDVDIQPSNADAKEISETDKSSMNTNIIIVIVLIGIMICLVGYSIMKKRKSRRSSEINEQEMKPLNTKPTNGSNIIPEKKPLMNGQNGNMNGKPVEEPVAPKRNEELDSRTPPEDEVVLRKKKRDEESLLPETHRVTIQAKELSTPKTPLLVNRLRCDDGQIITTPSRPDEHL